MSVGRCENICRRQKRMDLDEQQQLGRGKDEVDPWGTEREGDGPGDGWVDAPGNALQNLILAQFLINGGGGRGEGRGGGHPEGEEKKSMKNPRGRKEGGDEWRN